MSDPKSQSERLLQEALKRPEGERVPFLREQCGDDRELLQTALDLLDQWHRKEAGNSSTDRPAEPPGDPTVDHPESPVEDAGFSTTISYRSSDPANDDGLARGTTSDVTSRTDIEEESLPHDLGRYQVKRVLGRGGFGVVYLAYDPQLKRSVAIKVPRWERLNRDAAVELYLQEARTLAQLDHPGIVPVYDCGRSDEGHPFVVSKYIEGSSLRDAMRHRRFSPSEAARLVADIAEALQHAHRAGIVHRDIKPDNILLAPPEPPSETVRPMLADFGIALRAEMFGQGPRSCGTIAYMSPEQARGHADSVDGRSDIYSLGVVLYELLTGQRPYRAQKATSLLGEIADKSIEIRPPRQLDAAAPAELEQICLKALAKQPEHRYSNAWEMATELRRFGENPRASVAGFEQSGASGRSPRSISAQLSIHRTGCGVAIVVASLLVMSLVTLGPFDRGHPLMKQEQIAQNSRSLSRSIPDSAAARSGPSTDSSAGAPNEPPHAGVRPSESQRVEGVDSAELKMRLQTEPGVDPNDLTPDEIRPFESASKVDLGTPDTTANGESQPIDRVEVGYIKVTDQSFMSRRVPPSDTWMRVPPRTKVMSGDQLLVLPTYHPEIVLAPGIQVRFAGKSAARLLSPSEAGEPGLQLPYGRLFAATAGVAGSRIRLDLGNRQAVATFADPNSELAVEVRHFLAPGTDPESQPAIQVAFATATVGRVEWRDAATPEPVVMETGHVQAMIDDRTQTLPLSEVSSLTWIRSIELRDVERLASQNLESSLPLDYPIEESLRQRQNDRRSEVRSLAACCLACLGYYDGLVNEFADERQRAYWSAEFDALRQSMARGREYASRVREALKRGFGDDDALLYELLCGYSNEQLNEGADAKLVELLDHESLPVRVLAFENLRRITQTTMLYRPEAPESRRLSAVRSWREKLASQGIRYESPPSPLSEDW